MFIVVHKNEYRLKVSHMKVMNVVFVVVGYSGIILFMGSAIERRRYIVTSSLIGWAHVQNGPWVLTPHWGNQTVDESVYMNRMRDQYDISKLKHSTANYAHIPWDKLQKMEVNEMGACFFLFFFVIAMF